METIGWPETSVTNY